MSDFIGGIREVRAPVRLQLSRLRGFNLQDLSQATNGLPAVNVARPSKWGNMFKVGNDHSYYGGPDYAVATAEHCVELYRRTMDATPGSPLHQLRGRNLGKRYPGATFPATV